MKVQYLYNDYGNKAANAYMIEMKNGDTCLISYTTHVATVTADGSILRHWAGKSNTTMRHFRHFVRFFDIDCEGSAGKLWDSLEVTPSAM